MQYLRELLFLAGRHTVNLKGSVFHLLCSTFRRQDQEARNGTQTIPVAKPHAAYSSAAVRRECHHDLGTAEHGRTEARHNADDLILVNLI